MRGAKFEVEREEGPVGLRWSAAERIADASAKGGSSAERVVVREEQPRRCDGDARVGAAVGGVAGAVAGGIADDQRPKFRTYVTSERRPSYAYKEKVVVGAKLPTSGVTYYDVPKEYGVTKYRYTVVNDRPVLVDPGTHSIVQVIE